MATIDTVQKIYVAFFNRPADALGAAFWASKIDGGMTEAQVAASFAASDEYKALYTGLDTANIVAKLYTNLFGRTAAANEVLFWGNRMLQGLETVDTIALKLANSAQGSDATAIADKIAASEAFTNGLDTTAKITGYSGLAANVQARAWLATVVDDASLASATSTVSTAISNALNANAAASGQTFTLTTGVDSSVATNTGINTFYAALDNKVGVNDTTATLGGADTITGKGTANTLYITDAEATGTDVIPVGASISNIQTITLKTAGNAGSGANAFDVSGISGAKTLSVTSSGTAGDLVKAAVGTTDVTVTSVGSANAVTVQGGNNVAVTNSGAVTIGATAAAAPAGGITVTNSGTGTVAIDGGSSITLNETGSGTININRVGAAATATTGAITVTDTGVTTNGINVGIAAEAPTGAITINATTAETATATAGNITVVGGTTVTVNETVGVTAATAAALAAGGATITVTQGNENVTGTATTTTVNLSQTAAVTAVQAQAAVAGVTGVTAVTGVVAAPGVQGVTAVTGVAAVPASAAVASVVGAVNGSVTVTDVNNASATKAGTITSVTANGYSTATINDNNLQTLSLANGGNFTVVSNAGGYATPATSLALTLNNVSGTFTDTGAGYTTLNVTTAGAASTLASIADTSLKTLNIAGNQVLNVTTVPGSLTAIAVSGAAGFSGDVSALGSALKLTTSSSGVITTTLDDTTQSFTGSTGQDIITISADATKAITGGSATNNEIVLNAAASTFTAAKTGANVTHFTTLGTNTGSTGSYDLSVLSGFNAIDVQANTAGATTFTNVAAGTSLALDASVTTALTYQTADTSGASDTVSVTLGTASNAAALTEFSLTLEDANLVGISKVNLVSNDKTAAGVNTITTLVDNGLSVLNVSGNAGLTIGTLNEASTAATSFTLNNTETGTATTGVTITSFTDASLGNLTFTGTGASFITTLTDAAGNLTINNTDAAGATIGTIADAGATGALSLTLNFTGTGPTTIATSLTNTNATTTSLTLNDSSSGNVSVAAIAANANITTEVFKNTGSGTMTITADNTATASSITLQGNIVYNDTLSRAGTPVGSALAVAGAPINTVTSGVTIAGGTDNAHVNINLTGAAATKVDAITLGNGNDLIIDGSVAGTVNVTAGTGSNLIILGGATTNTTGAFNVTLGAHTATSGIDQINVGTGGTAYATAANYVITGAVTGDIIKFVADGASSAATLTATSTAASTTAAGAIGLIEAALGTTAHNVAYGVFNGNTYIAETVSGTLAGTDTTIVELVGVHTLTASAGIVTVAS